MVDKELPLMVEVLVPVPTYYTQCPQCETFFHEAGIDDEMHNQQVQDYPDDLVRDYVKLCDWMREVARRHAGKVMVRIVDPQSLIGVAKALRHRVRTYPTFVVAGREKYTGWDQQELERMLARHLFEGGVLHG